MKLKVITAGKSVMRKYDRETGRYTEIALDEHGNQLGPYNRHGETLGPYNNNGTKIKVERLLIKHGVSKEDAVIPLSEIEYLTPDTYSVHDSPELIVVTSEARGIVFSIRPADFRWLSSEAMSAKLLGLFAYFEVPRHEAMAVVGRTVALLPPSDEYLVNVTSPFVRIKSRTGSEVYLTVAHGDPYDSSGVGIRYLR